MKHRVYEQQTYQAYIFAPFEPSVLHNTFTDLTKCCLPAYPGRVSFSED